MTQPTFDPYATLGVARGADAAQVRAAYRRLARQHHPDRTTDRRATERMQRINRAWEILSDPTRRARHDLGAEPSATAAGHWSTSRRRAAQWTAPPPTWSSQAAATRHTRTWTTYADDEADGQGWFGVVALLFVLLVVVPILLGGLPVPFFGLLALLAAGWLTRRIGAEGT